MPQSKTVFAECDKQNLPPKKPTSLTSEILGMRIIEAGVISDGPADPKDWPYQTVLEAINDGWRVIKFPEMSLMLDGSRTYGLGFDFILERY